MVSMRPKPVKEGSLSKSKQAKQVGKELLYPSKDICCANKWRPFTAEWYASRGGIEEVLREGSLYKSKQAKQVGKKVLCRSKDICCANKGRPFTAEWYASRGEIMEVLRFYRELLMNRELLDERSQELGMSPVGRKYRGLRVHIRAARILECLGKWVNTSKQIGDVSGIKVGDEFLWRGELSIVGLHHDFQRGIDCMKLINGKITAVSIVDSGRYDNVMAFTSDKLTYCGEGENPNLGGGKKPKDQKLVGGNLALKNSMDDKRPVRVIRRFNNIGKANDCGYRFVYDGLYRVAKYWKEKGEFGTYVYKFSLVKMEGQPQLDLGKKRKKLANGSVGRRKTLVTAAGNSFDEARNGEWKSHASSN